MASPNESQKLQPEENDNTLEEQTTSPPNGWLIELRPRPGGKQQDQFFNERVTGKQFRSLKDALKHVGSISNQTAIDYPMNTVAYPWTEMMKKRGKKKITNEPQPTSHSKIQSEPEPLPQPQPLTELPVGIRRSTYYRGAALDLPDGWVIELRPRPSGRHEDQFFHERLTGKLFRSMKEVSKRLGSSDKSTIDESADAVAHTLSAVMKRRGKRKRPDEPQPRQQSEIQHEPGPHTNPEVEPQVWPQPQREALLATIHRCQSFGASNLLKKKGGFRKFRCGALLKSVVGGVWIYIFES